MNEAQALLLRVHHQEEKSLFNQMSNPGSFTKKRRSKVRYIQQEKKYKKKALKNRLIALESVEA